MHSVAFRKIEERSSFKDLHLQKRSLPVIKHETMTSAGLTPAMEAFAYMQWFLLQTVTGSL